MRKEFAEAIIRVGAANDRIVFLTGDLGYMALEQVKARLGDRFINTGVAEQNMATIAASLAYEGFIPFIYSISPFVTLRPYEQLRNDICLHHLPVKIVANGGGYGYGIMGSTHHNIEDIGAMRILPHMQVFVPFTAGDVGAAVNEMIGEESPCYLRLNMASGQDDIPGFAQWRKIKEPVGERKAVVIGTGSVTDQLFKLPAELINDLEIWLLSTYPVYDLPGELLESISDSKNLITLEEHRGQCGMHEAIASLLLKKLQTPIDYHTLYANGYPSGRYGSQQWHLEENSLAGKKLVKSIQEFLSHSIHVVG